MLAAVLQTVHDAEGNWLLLRHSPEAVTGLVGGRLVADPNGVIRLQGYSSVPGLAISGNIELKMDPYGDPVVPLTVRFGSLAVTGPGTARGRLSLSGSRMTGTLARRAVSATF